MVSVSGRKRVARPPARMATGSIRSGTGHERSAFKIEAHAHFAQTGLPHHAAQAGLVFGVEHEETTAAGADEFSAERAVSASQFIALVDAGVRHRAGTLLLELPVLVHDFGESPEVTGFERRFALIPESFDLVQVVEHARVTAAGACVLLRQNSR